MARGYIGRRQGFQVDPSVFLQGDGRENKGDDAIAMALLGYGKGTSPRDQALQERTQAALEMLQQGQLSKLSSEQKIAEENQKAAAETREYGKTKDIQERMDLADREATRKQELANSLAAAKALNDQKLAGDTLKEMLPYFAKDNKGMIVDPEYAALKERATPGLGAEVEQAKAGLRNRQVQEGLARYQKATPKEREVFGKGPGSAALGPPDVVDEILKQAGVQVAPPGVAGAAPGAASGEGGVSGGIADALWNLPGGTENLYNWMANAGGKAWYGKDAPQYPYVPWTHAADEWTKGGPKVAPAPVGPAPRPEFGNYGPLVAEEAPPQYQYGVGQQRPPPASLNDLLAKALQGQ